MTQVRIMLVDDHALFREGLALLLKGRPNLQVVAEAATGEEALVQLESAHPDLVLLDLNLPGIGGVETCRLLKERAPELRVVILTMSDDLESIFEAVRAGACGYLLKDIASQNLLEAIDQIDHEGGILEPFLARRLLAEFSGLRSASRSVESVVTPGPALSPRETEILQKVVDGLSNKEIADRLCISKYTVGNHINNIFRKLGVNDRTQAAVAAIKMRLV
ncbi:MAG: response regulator [Candidatus Xenobium sp.]|nr:response regulator transcription factor [Burkholderiales bacterium]